MRTTPFCIVLNCCCILAATGLPPDCRFLCDRRLGIRVSSYLMTLPRQLCTESNYTPLAIEVRVCGPSPELRCLSMARASKSISPKGTTRNHAFLENGIEKARCEIFQFLWEETIVDDQKNSEAKGTPHLVLTTKKQGGQRLQNHIKPIIKTDWQNT